MSESTTSGLGRQRMAWRLVFSFLLSGVIAGSVGWGGLSSSPCAEEQQSPELLLPDEGASAESPGEESQTALNTLRFEDLQPFQVSESWRFGLGVPGGAEQSAWVTRLGAAWWYSWDVHPPEGNGGGGEFWQMIRLRGGKLTPPLEQILAEAQSRPGQIWIVGNEPDVIWQDGISPACLAYLYHQVYAGLKRVDPTAQVAPGGIAQASSLRLTYLDKVLVEYERRYNAPLWVDFWTMHAFILPERRGGWGAGIPPGLDDDFGWLKGITDHDDVGLFRSQVVAFRRWLAAHGYRDRPLVITEYGILMPGKYGFDTGRVRRFMLATFELLMTARDPELGLPSDDNRLVQRWAWFSLADPIYPAGNLIVPDADRLTPLGMTYREFIAETR